MTRERPDRRSLKTAAVVAGLSAGLLLAAGCTVYTAPPPEPPPIATGPVVEGPGVELISVEPVPEDRVYVYDPGYPPGTYFYGGYYYYGGYRYPHDVFVDRYVVVNQREHRYFDADANRRAAVVYQQRQRDAYVKVHGGRPGGPVVRPGGERDERRERQ